MGTQANNVTTGSKLDDNDRAVFSPHRPLSDYLVAWLGALFSFLWASTLTEYTVFNPTPQIINKSYGKQKKYNKPKKIIMNIISVGRKQLNSHSITKAAGF